MSLDHPAALPPPVSDSWEVLADGLLTQRLALHHADIQAALPLTAEASLLPAEASPALLLARPETAPASALILVDAAGLGFWTALPQRYGVDGASPLVPSVQQLGATLAADCSGRVADAVLAVCGAAGWWTGAFAAIRYNGGHPRTGADVTTPVSLAVLEHTTRLVALGMTTRLLRRFLQVTGDADETLRAAFCRTIAETVVAESTIDGLVEELGELRLADLLVNTAAWRGRHTAYRSGLGSGQVE
ncbi:hypothetical protein ACFVV7_26900 [Streptomyces globisporus]|uniref:hypothetical protein n=1 Tax=Streptomyces globisporus TaxID=1908 RepID=UPI0036D83444